MKITEKPSRQKPDWLKVKIPSGEDYKAVKKIVSEHALHTICQSGKCPNMAECWGRGTATFMILGDICTRACRFCAVKTGRPDAVNKEEPYQVARSIQLMKLKHCVITSVDRDDLPDYGSEIWQETILAVKELNPETTIEVLIPDFKGKTECIDRVIAAQPNVISHNMETVRRLTRQVRRNSDYDRSLGVIRHVAQSGIRSKSGVMVGLGESREEVLETMDDLRGQGCEVITIGQYLQPTHDHMKVEEFIKPALFKEYETLGLAKRLRPAESGALVRSSSHAETPVL